MHSPSTCMRNQLLRSGEPVGARLATGAAAAVAMLVCLLAPLSGAYAEERLRKKVEG